MLSKLLGIIDFILNEITRARLKRQIISEIKEKDADKLENYEEIKQRNKDLNRSELIAKLKQLRFDKL